MGAPHRVRRWTSLCAAGAAICIGGYALAAFIAVPLLADRAVARYAARSPEHDARVDRYLFNPFTLTLTLKEASVADPAGRLALTAPQIRVNFSAATLLERRPVLDALAVTEPRVSVEWPLGRGTVQSFLATAHVERLEIDGAELRFRDRSGLVEREWSAAGIAVDAQGLGAADGQTARFTIAAANGAELTLDGEVDLAASRAHGHVGVRGLDLALLAPWLELDLAALAPAGRLDLDGEFALSVAGEAPELELAPVRAELRDFRLEPAPGLIVGTPRAAAGVRAALTYAEGILGVRGRVTVEDASLEVFDARFDVPWPLRFAEVAGTFARGEPEATGVAIELEGAVAGGGAASLAARLASERGGWRGSVVLRAAEIPAAAVAPYGVRMLGRGLAAGNVDLELAYTQSEERIDGGIRIGGAGVVLEGEPAQARALAGESPLASAQARPPGGGLPLDLAAALLTDASGRLELAAPISARADAGVPAAVSAAVRARLEAIAAAPFEVLGRLVELDGRTLAGVEFEPGAAEFSDFGAAGVRALAAALAQRPKLALRAHGGFDPRVDRDALAARQIELHVLIATAGPQMRARPEPVNFASPRAQDVLDEFAGERLPPQRLEAIAARFSLDPDWAPDAPARVAYYRAVFAALVASETIADSALTRLGRFRAQSIAHALAELGVEPERVLIGGGDLRVAAGPRGVQVPLDVTARRD